MDIPPLLRVSLQAVENLNANGSNLFKFKKFKIPQESVDFYHKNHFPVEALLTSGIQETIDILITEANIRHSSRNTEHFTLIKSTDKVYPLAQISNSSTLKFPKITSEDTVGLPGDSDTPDVNRALHEGSKQEEPSETAVQSSITHSNDNNVSIFGCLSNSLGILGAKDYRMVKLRPREVDILSYRILSLTDHISQSQLSKLIYSLVILDKRFKGLVLDLSRHYLVKSDDGSDILTHSLVLSSLSIYKKWDELFDTLEIERKLLHEIEIKLSKGEGNQTAYVILLRLMTMFHDRNDEIIKRTLQLINLSELDNNELTTLIHSCSLFGKHDVKEINEIIDLTLDKICDCIPTGLSVGNISLIYHFFYLSGRFDHKLCDLLAELLVQNNTTFTNSVDFYRVAFPLVISNRISEPNISKWLLYEFASNSSLYSRDVSQFLFVLTALGNVIKIKNREKLRSVDDEQLVKIDYETDLYEKALIYLKQAEHGKVTFNNTRSAIIHLYDQTSSLHGSCTHDQFIQLLQAYSANLRIIKINTRLKLEIMRQCRLRVDEIPVGGVAYVLEFVVNLYSFNHPDVIALLTLYVQRILSDISLYNTGDHSVLQSTSLYKMSYLTDVAMLANVLFIIDTCNLNSNALANEVSVHITNNYNILDEASISHIARILHYLSSSPKNTSIYDTLLSLLSSKMAVEDACAEDMLLILESLLMLNLAQRYNEIVRIIEDKVFRVKSSSSTVRMLITTLSKVTNRQYTNLEYIK